MGVYLDRKADRLMDPAERAAYQSSHKPPKKDYLKWWRLIRIWARAKSGLSIAEIELLLYLRSVPYFDRKDFDAFGKLMGWEVRRLKKMRDNGWIQIWREGKGRSRNIYCLSQKSKSFVDQIYAFVEGEEMPEHSPANPIFSKEATYNEARTRNMVKTRNKEIRERRQHRVPR
jgi:predicted transcriptional regulator